MLDSQRSWMKKPFEVAGPYNFCVYRYLRNSTSELSENRRELGRREKGRHFKKAEAFDNPLVRRGSTITKANGTRFYIQRDKRSSRRTTKCEEH